MLTTTHVSGGTIAALIAFLASRYGWNVSDTEAATFGAGAAAAGAAVAHLFTGPGLIPAVKRALFGPAK